MFQAIRPAKVVLFVCCVSGLHVAAVRANEETSQLSATVTGVSDYVADGISASDSKPALQVGIDYTHASGMYAGFWGSNVDGDSSGTPDVELDYAVGYAPAVTDQLVMDVGITRYTYERVKQKDNWNYNEWYFGLVWKENTAFYFYQSEDEDVWVGEQRRYILSHTQPLTGSWVLLADLERLEYESAVAGDYLAWRIGVAREWAGLDVSLSFWDNNIDGGDDTTADRFVLEVSRGFDLAAW